jgi:Flp pilus assembly pilin Flp
MQFLNEIVARLINTITDAKDEAGQTLVEYALIIALVSVTAVIALQGLSTGINGVFSSIVGSL